MNSVTAKDMDRQKFVTEYQNPDLGPVQKQGVANLINSTADEVQNDAYAHLDTKAKDEINQLYQGNAYKNAIQNKTVDDFEKKNQGILRQNFMNVIKQKHSKGELNNEQVRGLTLWANGKFGYVR
jgi:hypothetical protein